MIIISVGRAEIDTYVFIEKKYGLILVYKKADNQGQQLTTIISFLLV